MATFSTFEQLTVADTAIGISSAVRNPDTGGPMKRFTCRLETAQIRYRTDGTAPTASVGTVLEVGDVLTITDPEDAARIKFIRTGGTSGVLDIEGFQ